MGHGCKIAHIKQSTPPAAARTFPLNELKRLLLFGHQAALAAKRVYMLEGAYTMMVMK